MNRVGKLKINGCRLERHEIEILGILTSKGNDVEVIVASNQPGSRTPDILMNGVFWEIKSPTGKSKRTLENNLRKASEQFDSVIIDLRRTTLDENICINELRKQFKSRKNLKRMMIIKNNGDLLKF